MLLKKLSHPWIIIHLMYHPDSPSNSIIARCCNGEIEDLFESESIWKEDPYYGCYEGYRK